MSTSERIGEVREILDSTTVGVSDANVSTTLVRNPALFRRWIPFGTAVMNGTLPARERELLILRTGFNCRAPYEWAQHSLIALRVGIGQDEIDRIASDRWEGWSAEDASLLGAADELHTDACITDETWADLATRFSTEQLIEIPAVVGLYHMLAMTLNSLGVQCDEGLPAFPG